MTWTVILIFLPSNSSFAINPKDSMYLFYPDMSNYSNINLIKILFQKSSKKQLFQTEQDKKKLFFLSLSFIIIKPAVTISSACAGLTRSLPIPPRLITWETMLTIWSWPSKCAAPVSTSCTHNWQSTVRGRGGYLSVWYTIAEKER